VKKISFFHGKWHTLYEVRKALTEVWFERVWFGDLSVDKSNKCIDHRLLVLAADVLGQGFLLVLVQTQLDGVNILRWIGVFLLEHAVGSIFIAWVVGDSESSWSCPGHFALDSQQILSDLQSHVSHLAPVLSPGVANDPVLDAAVLVSGPANDGNDVVGVLIETVIGEDAAGVLHDWLGVDGGGNSCVEEDERCK